MMREAIRIIGRSREEPCDRDRKGAARRLDSRCDVAPAIPVLLLHARGDPLIPFDQARELLRAYGSRAELQAFDGRHHARGFAREPEAYFRALAELVARLP